MTKAIGHDGKPTFYAYDAKGRETERAVFPASYATQATRPALNLAESVVSTAWHASFNLPTKRAEPSKLTGWTHEADGMPASHEVASTSAATGALGLDVPPNQIAQTGASGWTYDMRRLPATASESRPGATALALSLSYAANGDLVQIRDAASAKTLTIRTTDVHGAPTAWPDGDGVAHSIAISVRRQLREEVRGFNRNKQFFAALYSFDAAHNLVQMTINGQVVSAPSASSNTTQSLAITTGTTTLAAAAQGKPSGDETADFSSCSTAGRGQVAGAPRPRILAVRIWKSLRSETSLLRESRELKLFCRNPSAVRLAFQGE